MGTPAPIRVPGLFCAFCWGPGQPFGDVATNKYITVDISGVEKAPLWLPIFGEPVNGQFAITQSDVVPCRWTYETGPETITLIYTAATSQLQIANSNPQIVFRHLCLDLCCTEFENQDFLRFQGGIAKLTIPGAVP